MTQDPLDERFGHAVPRGRFGRMMRFGAIATGIAGGVAAGGLGALARGQRLDMAGLLLSPANGRRLTEGLSHLRGAALKLGQMLSMDTGVVLSPELTAILAQMREDARVMPPQQLRAVLDSEWGPGWYGRFARFDIRPFAAASIGQVHRARLPDGRDLAIKVQYPGVRDSIDSDIANMASLLRLPGLVPRDLDLTPILDEARAQLHREADYETEARNLTRFAALLADQPQFLLPGLCPALCTPRVLAMDYVDSQPLDQLLGQDQGLRDRVARDLIVLVLRELFDFGLMQTDPNLANYRFQPATGRIVLLDFGAVQAIAPDLAQDFRTLAQAALGQEAAQIRAAIHRIGYVAPHTPEARQELIQSMFDMAMAPVRQTAPFDFGSSDLLHRLHAMGQAIGSQRDLTHVPPAETLFLHRKIGGMYLLAARLRARLALRPLVEAHCATSGAA